MLKRVIQAATLLLSAFLALSVAAKSQLSIADMRHAADGVDRIFTFKVENGEDREAFVHGKLVAINVYDTAAPSSIPVEGLRLAGRGVAEVSVRWHDAPLLGPIRVIVILEGGGAPLVEAYTFWLLPDWRAVAAAIFSLALATLAAWLLGRRKKQPVPRKPIGSKVSAVTYTVEPGDTVMTLSSRFDVSWQDLVRANRLKPPYQLVPGRKLVIQVHPLRKKI